MSVDGIDVSGPMPKGLEIVNTFSWVIGASSTQAGAACALLDFIASPAADEAIRHNGMTPTRPD